MPCKALFSLLRNVAQIKGVLALCFAVRLACLLFYPVDPSQGTVTPDEWHEVAVNLVQGRGYTVYAPQAGVYDWDLTGTERAYRPTMRVPPVYPFVLASLYGLFGVHVWIGQLAQILFDVVTAWVIYRIGLCLFTRQAGLLAALGWALYAPEATHVLKLRSEPLFTLLLCLWVWTVVERRDTRRFAPLFLLPLTVLCRPSMAGFAVVCGLVMTFTDRPHRLSLPVLGVMTVPWLIRGWLLFGALVPIATNGGYSLYRSVFTLGKPTYITTEPPDFTAAYAAFVDTLRRQQDTPLPQNEAELDAMFGSQAWALIRAYPFRYARLCAEHVMRLWFRLYGGVFRGWKDWITALFNAGLLILAWPGLRGASLRRVGLLPALIAYNTLFYALILADPRYNTPIIPLLLVLSAQGLLTWIRIMPAGRKTC